MECFYVALLASVIWPLDNEGPPPPEVRNSNIQEDISEALSFLTESIMVRDL